ncbi:uncharacterized protein METZ01_LOCUS237535 [marine metagenome]|uniref:Uncharacterized protein n=1 Tax=marine metagenome TaxID=408172 RepID=A0A382HDX1_9ZZZZ
MIKIKIGVDYAEAGHHSIPIFKVAGDNLRLEF